jgi:multicomponent Na+:H+ antiporter subunit F
MISFAQGLEILLAILSISTVLCFIRLSLGPTIPNRTAAFDTIAIHAVAILALYAIRIDAPSILDVAIITAVLGFLGTTIMARYLERTAPRYYALSRNSTNVDANSAANSATDNAVNSRSIGSIEDERSPLSMDRSDPDSP